MNSTTAKGKASMNDYQLERTLRSIGMACFVKYFRFFADPSFSKNKIVEIMDRNGETWSTKASRANNGRRICRENRHKDALQLVVCSNADHETRIEAARLLDSDF